jgi:hypothetical protein
MVTLLFTAIFIIGLLAGALYFWQKPSHQTGIEAFDDPPGTLPRTASRGLFDNAADDDQLGQLNAADATATRELLRARAAKNDHAVLEEAHKNSDAQFYDELLRVLVEQADSDAKLLSVLSYVTRTELPVSKDLARAVIRSWESSPDRGSTARTLHITALADDAMLFQTTVASALSFWRQGLIANVSAAELRALFDGEFWVLSTPTRSSGAGFVLKRTLAHARRELEKAMRDNQ